jgi:hypothetical protein
MPLPLIIGAAVGAYKIYDSIHKSSQAKKLAKSNIRPVYKADGSIQDVVDLAGSELNDKTSSDYADRELRLGQSAGIDAILKSGGKADFSTINSTYGNNLTRILAQVQQERDRKVAAYNTAQYNLAKSKDAEFMYNQDGPYKDKKQQEAQLRQQSAQSASDATNAIISGVSAYGMATNKPGEYGTVGTGSDGSGMGGTYYTSAGAPATATPGTPLNRITYPQRSEGTFGTSPFNPTDFNSDGRVNVNNIMGIDSEGNPIYYGG